MKLHLSGAMFCVAFNSTREGAPRSLKATTQEAPPQGHPRPLELFTLTEHLSHFAEVFHRPLQAIGAHQEQRYFL